MKTNRKLKKPDSSSKLILEEIIGLTAKNCNGLASNTSTSKCAYTAGCVVVVYNVDLSSQAHLMVSHRMPKPLSCVAMSPDGRFVAAGELYASNMLLQSGPQPAVFVWDSANLALISELNGHLYGVECIAFSPDGEHLVSVGGYIYIWNWRSGMLITKLKASSSCSAFTSVSFSSDSKFIVTAGKKHLKFWTIGSSPRTRLNKRTESLTLHAKPANLGLQKGSSFVSVVSASCTDDSVVNHEHSCEPYPIYALTDAGYSFLLRTIKDFSASKVFKVWIMDSILLLMITGVLCLVNSGLSVTKSVDLEVEKGFALSASDKFIACACSNGAVKLFTNETLKYAETLNYSMVTKFNGESDIICRTKTTGLDFHVAPTLPDAIACQFSSSEKLVVVYGDHSLYIWDVHDVKEATRCCVLVSHSACIWDVKNLCCENMHDPSLACVARGCSGGVSFSTCSADGTIRLWDLALQPDLPKDAMDHGSSNNEEVGTAHLVSAGIFERDTIETGLNIQGFRSMAVSADGKYLAAGDCEGNLHIYDLQSSDYTCFKDAHDAEILSLNFSLPSKKYLISEEVMGSQYFLASGGKDRTIHLYDVKRKFDLVESIDDHSAAVTSVKFTCNGCKILSCSADRSLVFRDFSITDNAYKVSRRHHQLASHGTVYDMVIDPTMEVVVTVGQDKKINSFDIAAGKLIRSFKQDKDYGDPIKVTMDPSGTYLVCSYSNKSICLYDFITGQMITQAMGHGEVVTGVIFLPDCKHIVSVGGDGCIFVWKLPARLASRMLQRVKENTGTLSPRNLAHPVGLSQVMFCVEDDQKCRSDHNDLSLLEDSFQVGQALHYRNGKPQQTPTFRFSISRLPKWAQAKVTCSDAPIEFTSSQLFPGQSLAHCLYRVYGFTEFPRVSELKGCEVATVISKFVSLKELDSFIADEDPVKILRDGESSCRYGSCAEGVSTNKYASSNNIGFLKKNNDEHDMQNPNACNGVVAAVAEKSYSDKTEVLENIDVNTCHIKSEHSDLFKQHFGSLSATHKVEKRKSTARRRFSSQYVVRRDYEGCKRLFDTPVRKVGGERSTTYVTLENPAVQVIDSSKQVPKDLTQSFLSPDRAFLQDVSSKIPVKQNSVTVQSLESADQEKCIPERNELLERISECKESLLNLDAAAENVLHLFSKLITLASREECPSGPGAELYDEAAELLPSIADKLNALAKIVQNKNNSLSGKSGMEVSRFEPLLGTLAQSLSEKVVEILKNNLSTV
ncbi:hypothetical protein JRO89_XS12G0059000 [Xanthoceras sorbifolium]|uniref:MABP1/WDR62 second WD40 domain-containing protein n=1 Tax=Xanthoceras sorbifolium TaxID=99658 RepID=A0ABQ8HBC2_9ROSI|nr:hypothetical protein JRO89_XS12G0059000 [Xanthoceras sorbifolium]